MNTLWASLIGLILIALAVVLLFNLLQGRQNRLRDAWREKLAGGGGTATRTAPEPRPGARAEAPPRGAESGAGGGRDRIEPSFGPVGAAPAAASDPDPAPSGQHAPEHEPEHARVQATAAAQSGARDAPAPQGAVAPAGAGPAAPHPRAETGAILDPRLDCIVELTLGAPVAPERLLSAVSSLRRAGSKPVAIEADAGDGHWAIPHAARGALRRVRAGVLLANRNGPLNAMEFSEFGTAVQGLGRAIGAGGAVVPDMAPVLEHARQLDDACAQLDAVIGLNVETPTPLSPAELAALAFGLGLAERGNNRFAQLGENGEVLYSLALGERAEQLTLLLDVPRAPPEADPWSLMVDCAMQCAERTGGRLVDDAGRPLTESAVAGVASQLEQRYRSLEEAGLDAGSPAALRVFN
jgi:cell division septation protein DedD